MAALVVAALIGGGLYLLYNATNSQEKTESDLNMDDQMTMAV